MKSLLDQIAWFYHLNPHHLAHVAARVLTIAAWIVGEILAVWTLTWLFIWRETRRGNALLNEVMRGGS